MSSQCQIQSSQTHQQTFQYAPAAIPIALLDIFDLMSPSHDGDSSVLEIPAHVMKAAHKWASVADSISDSHAE